MKGKIKNKSRYGDDRIFTIIDEDTIELTGKFDFTRCAYLDDKTKDYYFIDFDGGPFISICSKLYLKDMEFEVFKIEYTNADLVTLKVIKLK